LNAAAGSATVFFCEILNATRSRDFFKISMKFCAKSSTLSPQNSP
jgi:hypothetical protein